ncbi:MAG: type II toxin-antitoxin system RelE/ParE family toxin [Gammaproteobacteria bacterium]|jgi:plasmid stabilization system protein ParE|nr:type II toxin-antitoxin system RelE/ParE family toxin [Gammaproteobacteria bacterium]
MKLKYAPEAVDDLHRVVEFVELKNPFAARRLANDLQEGIDKLKQFPNIGLSVWQAPEPEQIRDLYIGNLTVRYLVSTEIIYILRIWHSKENAK